MPIQRRATNSTIKGGNFSQAGVPLARVAQDSTPDFTRVAQALNVSGKKIAGKGADKRALAAQNAARQAIIDSQGKPVAERDAAMAAVRTKYGEQPWFEKLFTDENKAVKAIDGITGRMRALETRNEMKKLNIEMKDASYEDRHAAMAELLKRNGAALKNVSAEANGHYLKGITEHAVTMETQMAHEANQKNLERNRQKVMGLAHGETEETMGVLLGQTPAEANSSIKNLGMYRIAQKTNHVQIMQTAVAQGQRVMDDLAANGATRNQISQGAAETIINSAVATGNPRMLKALDQLRTKSGQKVSTFHAKAISKAREQILQTNTMRRQQLEALDKRKILEDSRQEAVTYSAEVHQITQYGEEGPQYSYESQYKLAQMELEVKNSINGDMTPTQFKVAQSKLNDIKVAKGQLVAGFGEEKATEAYDQMLLSGKIDLDVLPNIIHKLSKSDARHAAEWYRRSNHAEHQVKNSAMAKEQQLIAKETNDLIMTPMRTAKAFRDNEQNSALLEWAKSKGTPLNPPIPPIAEMQRAIVMAEKRASERDNKGGVAAYLTAEEKRAVLKPYLERWHTENAAFENRVKEARANMKDNASIEHLKDTDSKSYFPKSAFFSLPEHTIEVNKKIVADPMASSRDHSIATGQIMRENWVKPMNNKSVLVRDAFKYVTDFNPESKADVEALKKHLHNAFNGISLETAPNGDRHAVSIAQGAQQTLVDFIDKGTYKSISDVKDFRAHYPQFSDPSDDNLWMEIIKHLNGKQGD